MPAIPTYITDRMTVIKTFKVKVTSVCSTSLLIGLPVFDPEELINYIPDKNRIFFSFDQLTDTVSKNTLLDLGRVYPTNPYFCGKVVTTLELTKFSIARNDSSGIVLTSLEE